MRTRPLLSHDGQAMPDPVGRIALHRLPVQLRMLVRLMGEAAAFKLVQMHGGAPFTVPISVRSPAFRPLADLVGVPPATALVAELSRHCLHLPKYDAVVRQLRHQHVIGLRRSGRSLREAALASGYTMRQVINIMASSGLADNCPPAAVGTQHDLFGFADEAEPSA